MRRSTGLLALLALLTLPTAARATTFEVTRTDDPAAGACDPGDCSLREALSAAGASDGNIVHVPANATAYTLSTADFTVNRTMTVQGDGPGLTTVSGDADNRIFLLNGVAKTLTITGLTLSNGHVNGANALGGAIAVNNGALDVRSSVLTGNVAAATTGNGRGGAIDVAIANGSLADRHDGDG